jgi:DNA-binding NtrC family response regulator
MSENLFALLVHDHPEPFESLKRTLKDLSVGSYSVKTCKEAGDLISYCKPQIIFAESAVTDGSWVSVINKAEEAEVPLNVIVVAAQPDPQLYMRVMERGAYDFVAPPFEHEPLNLLLHSAAEDTHRRREALAQAALGW